MWLAVEPSLGDPMKNCVPCARRFNAWGAVTYSQFAFSITGKYEWHFSV